MGLDWTCRCGVPHCDRCGQVYYCQHLTPYERRLTADAGGEVRRRSWFDLNLLLDDRFQEGDR